MTKRSLSLAAAALLLIAACTQDSTNPTQPDAPAITQDRYVPTPGGFRLQSRIHEVAVGHSLRETAGGLQELDRSGRVVADLAPTSPLSRMKAFAPQLGAGIPGGLPNWISFALWSRPAGDYITADSTTWVVPPAPVSDGDQLLFLFNGLDDPYGQRILQPVLQWGSSAAGGDSHWYAACWFVVAGDAGFTSLFRVDPGETVVGEVLTTNHSANTYTCSIRGSNGGYSVLGASSATELYRAVQTLEAYGPSHEVGDLPQCNQYPATDKTALFAISIRTNQGLPGLGWTPVNNTTDCGQWVEIVSNANPGGEVDLHYSGYSPPLGVDLSAPTRMRPDVVCYATASAYNGTAPYTYQWSTGFIETTSGSSITQFAGGGITVTVTDANDVQTYASAWADIDANANSNCEF